VTLAPTSPDQIRIPSDVDDSPRAHTRTIEAELQGAAGEIQKGVRTMATMRRVDLSAITFLFIGTLCGALLMFGVGSLRQSNHHTAQSMVVTSSSSEMAQPIGGRLGGINSADAANDWIIRQSLSANDATVKTPVSQIVGPGEGLDQFVDQSSYRVNSDRNVGPGEGLNQYHDTTSFNTNNQRIIGPGEGVNLVP